MVRGRAARVALVLASVVSVVGCTPIRDATTRSFGSARTIPTPLSPGNIDPSAGSRTSVVDGIPSDGPVAELIEEWADRDLPDWETRGKVDAPRVVLAKLALGRDIDEVNRYLQAATPWARAGSTWSLRPHGDYDFSLPPLTALLYVHGDDPQVLYADTVEHLSTVLLNQEGGRTRTTAPGSMGLITETENHVLMIAGSRYLKNRWMASRGSPDRRHDNLRNGLEEQLVELLDELIAAGSYEFNSSPYSGYTAMALLTLEAFAAEPVSSRARWVLDTMSYEYAAGSLGLRRYAPFRRSLDRADRTHLTDHPQTALMRTWVWLATGEEYAIRQHRHQAVYAALMPYRIPGPVAEMALATERSHYVRIGRGPGASPEIYAAGNGYLISAGGAGRPATTRIVARPTVLFLDDDADDLSELVALGGAGDHSRWNNTGVIPGFAVARSPAAVPASFGGSERPLAASGAVWRVYRLTSPDLLVCIADTGTTAALYVTEGAADPQHLLESLEALAGAGPLDAGDVDLPDGRSVAFHLEADADTWVISALHGHPTQTDTTTWPRLSGGPPR